MKWIHYLWSIPKLTPVNAAKSPFSKLVIIIKIVRGCVQLLQRKDSPSLLLLPSFFPVKLSTPLIKFISQHYNVKRNTIMSNKIVCESVLGSVTLRLVADKTVVEHILLVKLIIYYSSLMPVYNVLFTRQDSIFISFSHHFSITKQTTEKFLSPTPECLSLKSKLNSEFKPSLAFSHLTRIQHIITISQSNNIKEKKPTKESNKKSNNIPIRTLPADKHWAEIHIPPLQPNPIKKKSNNRFWVFKTSSFSKLLTLQLLPALVLGVLPLSLGCYRVKVKSTAEAEED